MRLDRLAGAGSAPPGRVPAGRRRARVVRPGGAPAAAPSVAGAAAARGRAGRPGGAGPVPARVARHLADRREPAAVPRLGRPRAARRGGRPAGRRCRSRRPCWSATSCRRAIPGYQPRLLDELGALGEVAWVGRGSLGRDDGRIALVRPGREILRPIGLPDGTERPADPRHDAIREHLTRRGASFYRELYAAAGGGTDRDVLDALWDLVWAGEVTNDTFAPLRALRWKRTGSANGSRRPVRPGRLTSLGPPEAAGRWSLVDGGPAPVPTERLHALSLALLERHGVLTREAVAAEGIDGGFSAVYPVLRAMEEAGRIRRGYFVDGLGAAQFALAGALDRLRAVRDAGRPAGRRRGPCPGRVGPGQPVRRGPARGRAGARATGGRTSGPPARTSSWSTGSPRSTWTAAARRSRSLPAADEPGVAVAAARALRSLVVDGRFRELVIRKVDGDDVATSPFRADAARRRVRGRLSRPAAPWRSTGEPPGRCVQRQRRLDGRVPSRGSLSARRRHALPDGGGPAALPRRPDGDRGAIRRARPGAEARADHRPRDPGGRRTGQEPAHPVRQRPRDPDAPADDRVLAPLPAGRALAPAAGPGAAGARGPRRRCRLLRCAGRRAPRATRRVAPPGARQPRAGPPRPDVRCRRGDPPPA